MENYWWFYTILNMKTLKLQKYLVFIIFKVARLKSGKSTTTANTFFLYNNCGWDCGSKIEYIFSMHEALDSIPRVYTYAQMGVHACAHTHTQVKYRKVKIRKNYWSIIPPRDKQLLFCTLLLFLLVYFSNNLKMVVIICHPNFPVLFEMKVFLCIINNDL